MKYIFNIKLYLGTIVLGLLVTSCEEDLNQVPPSELSTASFWQNNEQAQLGIGAIYDAMQLHYASRLFYYGELRADNYVNTTTANGTQLNLVSNALQVTDGAVSEWGNLYKMIGRANDAIKNIPNIPGYNPSLLAEAYALRAYAYFDIVRVWNGAPVFLEPVSSLSDNLSRPATDGSTIMNDIVIPDMLKAEELMQNPFTEYRFSKSSIWAFEATVYMWLKDHVKAKEKLLLIKNSPQFSLVNTRESWSQLFLNDINSQQFFQTGPELILSLNFELGAGDRGGIYGLYFAGLPSIYISPLLENKWAQEYPLDSLSWVARYPGVANLPKTFIKDATGKDTKSRLFGDWRYFECREEGKAIGGARVAKWNKSNYNPNLDDTDIVLFRLPDMLLMLAECENQLDNPGEAYILLNRVRNSRQLPNYPSVQWNAQSKIQKEATILDERQFELLGEGKRWWDLRRTGRAVQVMGPINGQTEPTLLFPYFLNHVLQNIELEQLEPYR